MADIVFTAASGAVTFTGIVVYESNWADSRFNQTSQRTTDGTLVTYDVAGQNIINGVINVKNVTYADGELLRTWIREKAIYMLNNFTITIPIGVDLGNGKSVDILAANFTRKNMNGVLKYRIPGIYTIKFPYTYVRP